VTAKIAFAEVHAGLKRKHRENFLSSRDYALSVRQFEADCKAIFAWISGMRSSTRRDLMRQHPLRGFDAIHLSRHCRSRALSEKTSRSRRRRPLLRAAESEASPRSTSKPLETPDAHPLE